MGASSSVRDQLMFGRIVPVSPTNATERLAAFLTLFDHKALARNAGIAETCRTFAWNDERATCDMKRSTRLLPQPKPGRLLLLLGVLGSWGVAPAGAQNLDEGKSATQLFSSSCVTCHKSAAGLAKGRMQPTLFLFLKDHYTTGSSEAWSLSTYLASVDTPARSRKSSGSKKRPAPAPAAQQN